MIVIPSVGMVAALRSILNKTSGLQEPFTLRLYSNNILKYLVVDMDLLH